MTILKSIHPDFDTFINILDEIAKTIYDRLNYINILANI